METQPTYHKALVRRAKAYEHVGLYKAALGDVHLINRGENATADTEVRLWCPSKSKSSEICRELRSTPPMDAV